MKEASGCEPPSARSVMHCVMFGVPTSRERDSRVTTRERSRPASDRRERLSAMPDSDAARRAEIARLAAR